MHLLIAYTFSITVLKAPLMCIKSFEMFICQLICFLVMLILSHARRQDKKKLETSGIFFNKTAVVVNFSFNSFVNEKHIDFIFIFSQLRMGYAQCEFNRIF